MGGRHLNDLYNSPTQHTYTQFSRDPLRQTLVNNKNSVKSIVKDFVWAMGDGQCSECCGLSCSQVAWLQLFVHQCFELKGMTVYKFMHMALKEQKRPTSGLWYPHATNIAVSFPEDSIWKAPYYIVLQANFSVLWTVHETSLPFGWALLLFSLYRELNESLGVPIMWWKKELRVPRTYRTVCFQLDPKTFRIWLLFNIFFKKISPSLLLLVTGRNIWFAPKLSSW